MTDVIAEWESAKLKHRSAPVYAAGDAIARELEACRERLADLDNALRTYVDWHQSCADHHVDDCPEDGNCKACRVDRLVNLVLTAPASDAQAKSEAPLPETPQE